MRRGADALAVDPRLELVDPILKPEVFVDRHLAPVAQPDILDIRLYVVDLSMSSVGIVLRDVAVSQSSVDRDIQSVKLLVQPVPLSRRAGGRRRGGLRADNEWR